MNKRDRIDYILSLIKEQTEEFLEAEKLTGIDLTAEELVVAATETVINHPVTQMEYGSPIATVDRGNVSFMIDDDMDLVITQTGVLDDPD